MKYIPSPQGEVKFTGFEGEDAQKFREFISGAISAVWGTDKYKSFLGEVELKDQFIGRWDNTGHVMLGVPPDQPLSSNEGRDLAANIALHEEMDNLQKTKGELKDSKTALKKKDDELAGVSVAMNPCFVKRAVRKKNWKRVLLQISRN